MSSNGSSSSRRRVTLSVRTANTKCGDVTLECDASWSIGEVKEEIRRKHPMTPSVDQQKIIYGGKVASDGEKLADVFRFEGENESGEEAIVIHLVLSSSIFHRSVSSPAAYRHDPSTPTTSSPSSQLRHRATPSPYNYWAHQAYIQQMAAAAAAAGFSPPPTTTPVLSRTQSSPAPNSPDQAPAQEVPQHPPQQAQPHQQPQPQPQQQQRPNANANVGNIMGAAGGEEEDDDEPLARDWLDRIYLLFRACLLLSIFYFYTSSFRFGIASFVMLVIFIYQAGWLRINRVGGGGGGGERRQEQRETDLNENGEGDVVARENQPGIFATLFGLFSGFVASLVPQNPEVVAGN